MANNEIEATVTYSFLSGIRGFHVCKEVWKPILRERLNLSHERKNLHDRYAIAAYKRLPGRLADSIIGHLLREISRPTRSFFLLRGGVAFAEVIITTHRRSPLIQGGLEIPVKVLIEIEGTAKNRLIIDKYKDLVSANYKGPDLDGHFDDCTKDVLKELYVQEEEMSDSDEQSAEVEDKWTDDNYHVAINAVNH